MNQELIRLNEIRNYVIDKYPKCCLAHNYVGYEFKEDYDISVLAEELNNFFWLEYMNLCGCGETDAVQEIIKTYLNAIKNNSDEVLKMEGNEALLFLFMMYVLDSYEFTDHGSSIYGATLTELGKMYLDVLNIYTKIN